MKWRMPSELPTIIVITLVSVLIWMWAASETREQVTLLPQRVQLAAPDGWVVSPEVFTVTPTIDGSPRGAQLIRRDTSPIDFFVGGTDLLPLKVGTTEVDLVNMLDATPRIEEAGVRVVATEPPTLTITVDKLVEVAVPVRGVVLEGQTTLPPEVVRAEVRVFVPSALRDLTQGLVLDAEISGREVSRLEPGVEHRVVATLTAPGDLGADQRVRLEPARVEVRFTLESRIAALTLETVRVQIAGPPENHATHDIDIDPANTVLRDVTVTGDADLIRAIEDGRTKVYAMVHLTADETERRIESKSVSCFLAVAPDAPATLVDASVVGSTQMPVIRLQIEGRAKEE